MPIDPTQNIKVYEAGDTRQFTFASTTVPPASAQFLLYTPDGLISSLHPVQADAIVHNSLNIFFINRVLPQTPGIYTAQWTLWDAASRPYVTAYEIEIKRTEAFSFSTYGNPQDIVRSARAMFGRLDITFRDMQPYCQAADGYMDMYFGRVTNIPLGSASPLIADMSKVYTLWRFYCDQYSYDTKQEPPAIIHRKEDYDKLLDLIAAGSMAIPGVEVLVTTDVFALPDGTNKAVFDMRDFIDQSVSTNLLEYEEGRGD